MTLYVHILRCHCWIGSVGGFSLLSMKNTLGWHFLKFIRGLVDAFDDHLPFNRSYKFCKFAPSSLKKIHQNGFVIGFTPHLIFIKNSNIWTKMEPWNEGFTQQTSINDITNIYSFTLGSWQLYKIKCTLKQKQPLCRRLDQLYKLLFKMAASGNVKFDVKSGYNCFFKKLWLL